MSETGLIVLFLMGFLVYIFVIRIYIAYLMAKNRYRDPLGWVLLSLFFSPLLTWIILLIVGNDKDARDREERLNQYDRDAERRKKEQEKEAEKQYLNSSYEDNTH